MSNYRTLEAMWIQWRDRMLDVKQMDTSLLDCYRVAFFEGAGLVLLEAQKAGVAHAEEAAGKWCAELHHSFRFFDRWGPGGAMESLAKGATS